MIYFCLVSGTVLQIAFILTRRPSPHPDALYNMHFVDFGGSWRGHLLRSQGQQQLILDKQYYIYINIYEYIYVLTSPAAASSAPTFVARTQWRARTTHSDGKVWAFRLQTSPPIK
jgi:hypothetical protein